MDQNSIRIDIEGESAGFGEAAKAAERELDGLKQASEQASSSFRSVAGTVDQVRAQMLAMQERAQGASGAFRDLDSSVTRSRDAAIAAREQMALLANEKRRAAQAAAEAAKANTSLSTSISGGLSQSITNIANQMTDMAVQINGGVDATKALSQQLPQMLVGFGAAGAAIGFVAALLPNLVSMFSNAGGGAKTLAEAMSNLDKAVGDVGETTRTFDMEGLYEQFNGSSAVVRQATIEQLKFQAAFIQTSRLVAEKKFGESIGGLGSYSTLDKLAGAYAGSGAEKLSKQLGLPMSVASDLQPMLTGLKAGTEDVGLAFNRFGLSLLGGNAKARELAEALSTLAKSERDAAAASSAVSDALAKMSKGDVPLKTKDGKSGRSGKTKVDDSAFQDWYAGFKEREKAAAALEKEQLQAEALIATYQREDAVSVGRIARGAELAAMSERDRMAAEAVYQAEDKSARRQEQIIKQIGDEATRTRALADEKALLADQIDRVREASLASHDAQQTFDHGWQRALQNYSDNATNAALTAQGAFQVTTGVIEDTLVGFAMNTKATFRDMSQSILKYLAQVAARQAAMGLLKMATSVAGAYFGGAGSGYGQTSAQAAVGADINSAGLGGYHSGGIAGREPTFIRYHTGGIAGDEVPAVLKRGEGVFTEGQMKALGGGGAVSVQQVFNISGGGEQSSSSEGGAGDMKPFADLMANVTRQVIVQEMRSGGMLEKVRAA